jgi:hypothetical protein
MLQDSNHPEKAIAAVTDLDIVGKLPFNCLDRL